MSNQLTKKDCCMSNQKETKWNFYWNVGLGLFLIFMSWASYFGPMMGDKGAIFFSGVTLGCGISMLGISILIYIKERKEDNGV